MSAQAHRARGQRPVPEIRLRWWALALPATVFAAFLALLLCGSGAQAAPTADWEPVAGALDHLRQAIAALG
ncbi:hypothetical protein [Streptomyces sp. RFCAC02]|uniref:hypothetical protein n=1 Tax=Streptomyces sp. RFCAC02 TaxID=2499143 RepID=UPI00101F3AAA|nr:hypothetical protein [Streptomyces sp. RFCAC02]